jgi:cytosine/uracil/thiamine/allantoin permease
MVESHLKRRQSDTPTIQRVVAILWPSFLIAGVATVVFFTAFDPQDLATAKGVAQPISRLGAYTIGFFLFWALTLSACMLTCYFQRPCHDARSSRNPSEQP